MSAREGTLVYLGGPYEGGTRAAYFTRVENGLVAHFREGTNLVLKIVKPEKYREGVRISEREAEAQKLVKSLANEFNQKYTLTKGDEKVLLHIRTAEVVSAPQDFHDPDGKLCIEQGEKVLLEPAIEGEWEKFNSNNGWDSEKHCLPAFFSHWSYWRSNGRVLVCDLQGHRGDPSGPSFSSEHGTSRHYYLLTDPAVHSTEQRYGTTDLGKVGIESFFARHRCNSLCRHYGLERFKPASCTKSLVRSQSTTHRVTDERGSKVTKVQAISQLTTTAHSQVRPSSSRGPQNMSTALMAPNACGPPLPSPSQMLEHHASSSRRSTKQQPRSAGRTQRRQAKIESPPGSTIQRTASTPSHSGGSDIASPIAAAGAGAAGGALAGAALTTVCSIM